MTSPDWVRDAVFYQIFPDRFANAEAALDPLGTLEWGGTATRESFFGGDLKGIRGNLGHLTELGVNALYLTPIFAAGTNHRYDTIDYTRIDPALGDLPAFQRFLADAHGEGVRVVLDAVFHHCGDQHPAFQDVVANEAESPYVNWFYVADFPVRATPEPNYLTCSGCHYLPKLNVYSPQLRQHLLDVTRFWTATGIDGWRLDVPYMMENPTFWRQFRSVVKEIAPEAYIVAEVWDAATEWTRGDTSDAAMNYRLRDEVLDFAATRRVDATDFAAALAGIDQEIPTTAKGLMLNLLGSHDTERVLTHCGGDSKVAMFAYGLLFAAEGAPMIYYGDEIGMTGFNDPDCRQCMIWDRGQWNDDIYVGLRRLIRMRRQNVALRRGAESTMLADGEVIVRARTHPDQTVLVVANRDLATVTVDVPGYGEASGTDLLTGGDVKLNAVDVGPMEVRFVQPH